MRLAPRPIRDECDPGRTPSGGRYRAWPNDPGDRRAAMEAVVDRGRTAAVRPGARGVADDAAGPDTIADRWPRLDADESCGSLGRRGICSSPMWPASPCTSRPATCAFAR